MNFLQLILKQMRQRALGTALTMLSVLLGVALATATLLAQRESESLFGQTDFGYDVLIGPKGSELQLVLNTAYHVGVSQGTLPYAFYEALPNNLPAEYRGRITWKLPYAVGDYYEGNRIIGTLTSLFGLDEAGQPLPEEKVPQYRNGRRFKIAQGRVFHPRKFEAVIGAEVAKKTGLKIGSTFKGTHGLSSGLPTPDDEHKEQWTVVGILEATHTANDRVLFIPLVSFYAVPAHESALEEMARIAGPASRPADAHDDHDDHAGHDHAKHEHGEAYVLKSDGTIDLKLPKCEWRVSAILAATPRDSVDDRILIAAINKGDAAMAISPSMEMASFFRNILGTTTLVMLLISIMVSVVAAASILVSIYNSIAARRKEIAILRALGATRRRVVALICLEAGLIGLLGGLAGLVVGHLIGGVGSIYLQRYLGESVHWLRVDTLELLYLLGVVVLAVLAGLVPALKAYRTPVATYLVAS